MGYMYLRSRREGHLEGGRRPARGTREGTGEEEQIRRKSNDPQSMENAIVKPIALCANFKSCFFKRAKTSIMSSERSQVPKFHTASFHDMLGKAELGRLGCGQDIICQMLGDAYGE